MGKTNLDELEVKSLTFREGGNGFPNGETQSAIDDPTFTATPPAAIATTAAAGITAATDVTAAKLTDVQALQGKFNTLLTDVTALRTRIATIITEGTANNATAVDVLEALREFAIIGESA